MEGSTTCSQQTLTIGPTRPASYPASRSNSDPTYHQVVISWLTSSLHPDVQDIWPKVRWHDDKIEHSTPAEGVLVPCALMLVHGVELKHCLRLFLPLALLQVILLLPAWALKFPSEITGSPVGAPSSIPHRASDGHKHWGDMDHNCWYLSIVLMNKNSKYMQTDQNWTNCAAAHWLCQTLCSILFL